MQKIAIGQDDFKVLRQGNSYFVDKSMFIEEVLRDSSPVLLFPRPRRFGKTLNMSMMRYFFTNENTEENRKLFEGLAITQRPAWEQHQGKYPVVFLSLKEIKAQSERDFLIKIRQLISSYFAEHSYLTESDKITEIDRKVFKEICLGTAENAYYEGSLKLLTRMLGQHNNSKAIVLLDEYDTPIHEAYLNGFYREAVNFMRVFLGSAFKGNEYLQKGVLTGILRVSKESMFSDLNNVNVHSVLSEKFNTGFGFTQEEVDQMLLDFRMDAFNTQVKDWYNGYYFGNVDVYNPWSILNFVDSSGKFKAYWLGTSANELVHSLIRESDKSVKKDIEDALNNKPVYSIIDDNVSFQYLQSSREHILSFLVQTGYLKAHYHDFVDTDIIYSIEIPNIELSKIYYSTIQMWFKESIGSKELNEMLNALISGDIELFEDILGLFAVNHLSYFQTSKDHIEKVYHAFVLGMLISLKDTYHIESERESGFGRVDILMTPKDKSLVAIIMEMKVIRHRETAETALDAALQQIEDRNYEAALRQQGCTNIMKLAVTFDGKRVWAKTRQ